MSKRPQRLAVALPLLLLVASTAQAQLNPLKRQFGLSEDAIAELSAAAERLYAHPEVEPGAVEDWTADDGSAGSVQLVRRYEYEGMSCAHLLHQIKRSGEADALSLTSDRCLTPEGEWKIR